MKFDELLVSKPNLDKANASWLVSLFRKLALKVEPKHLSYIWIFVHCSFSNVLGIFGFHFEGEFWMYWVS